MVQYGWEKRTRTNFISDRLTSRHGQSSYPAKYQFFTTYGQNFYRFKPKCFLEKSFFVDLPPFSGQKQIIWFLYVLANALSCHNLLINIRRKPLSIRKMYITFGIFGVLSSFNSTTVLDIYVALVKCLPNRQNSFWRYILIS